MSGKKLRCTKNLIKMQKDASTLCFKQAEETISRRIRKQAKEAGLKITASKIREMMLTTHKHVVDDMYRTKLCKLPTLTLEAILLCEEKGKFRRMKITLDAIKSELTRRILLGDSGNKKELKSETNNQ